MTLELLICTIDDGVAGIGERLLPARDDVRYLVSWQYTGKKPEVPAALLARPDVRVVQLEGRGLCRNRNHALSHAVGDVLKICDDDEHWTDTYFDNILNTYRSHPEYDIVHFQAEGLGKVYPPRYVSSVELTMRRERIGTLRFDERFGLGSPCLNAGEEDVFMGDARREGLTIHYEAFPVSCTRKSTTGDDIRSPLLQRSKGAVAYRTRGLCYALRRSVREPLGWMLRRGMNPCPMMYNMLWGVNYIRTCQA